MKLISLFEKAFLFYHEVLEIVALFLCMANIIPSQKARNKI